MPVTRLFHAAYLFPTLQAKVVAVDTISAPIPIPDVSSCQKHHGIGFVIGQSEALKVCFQGCQLDLLHTLHVSQT